MSSAIRLYDELSRGTKPLLLWVHLFDAHARFLEHSDHNFGSKDVDRYDGEIAQVDEQLGQLIAHVKGSARSARTAWIIGGTHGEGFGEHGYSGHPASMFNESVRVPLVVAIPGVKPGKSDGLVSMIDVASTVVDLAGANGAGLVGTSLRGWFGGTSPKRDGVMISSWALGGTERKRAWVAGTEKLIHAHGHRGELTVLYDFGTDPSEKTELSNARAGRVKQLDEQLEAFLRAHRSEQTPSAGN